jgi:hypothetical protein
MKLFLFNEWLGPKRDSESKVAPRERHVAFGSELSVQDALSRLQLYRKSFNARYSQSAIEFRFLSVCEIDNPGKQLLDVFDVGMIESLDIDGVT